MSRPLRSRPCSRRAKWGVEKATANLDGSRRATRGLHSAEQVRLLVRLAADSGARRGVLVALQLGDLVGHALAIDRGGSAEQVGPTKSGRTRRLTLAASTAELWRADEDRRRAQLGGGGAFGPWVFSRDAGHRHRRTASGLAHWFSDYTHALPLEDEAAADESEQGLLRTGGGATTAAGDEASS